MDVAATTALTGVVNEYFVDIREWIKSFLQHESEVMETMELAVILMQNMCSIPLLLMKRSRMVWL